MRSLILGNHLHQVPSLVCVACLPTEAANVRAPRLLKNGALHRKESPTITLEAVHLVAVRALRLFLLRRVTLDLGRLVVLQHVRCVLLLH